MHTLYNSDSFVVVSFDLPASAEPDGAGPARGGFEIVDKFRRKEIFIEGAVAASFHQGVQALVARQADRADPGDQADQGNQSQDAMQAEIDDYIAGFTALAQQPVLLH